MPGKSTSAHKRADAVTDVLIHMDSTPASMNALAYANTLVGDGNIACLMLGLLAPYPMTVYMDAMPDVWVQAQKHATAQADAIEKKVREAVGKLGRSVEFRRREVMEGEAGRSVALQARYADLLMLGWSKGGGNGLEPAIFSAALFNSGRPVLLVPESYAASAPPRRILVAWSGAREATRAVHDALPLLRQAELVRIVTVVSSSGQGEEDPGADIARHLARHDVTVEVKQVPGNSSSAAKLVMDDARYFGADLVVMGGYGHSRVAEWIMGGMTRDVLADLHIPVLFSH